MLGGHSQNISVGMADYPDTHGPDRLIESFHHDAWAQGAKGPYILDDGLKSSRVARHEDGHENGDGNVAAKLEDLQSISKFSVAALHPLTTSRCSTRREDPQISM